MLDARNVDLPCEIESATLDIQVEKSVALRRLIEEVRNEPASIAATAYNRTYHRHNR